MMYFCVMTSMSVLAQCCRVSLLTSSCGCTFEELHRIFVLSCVIYEHPKIFLNVFIGSHLFYYSYVTSIETKKEAEDCLRGMLDLSNPKHKKIFSEFIRRWRPPTRNIDQSVPENMQVYCLLHYNWFA